MKYKYFVMDNERKGTCYHEFYRGEWDEVTFWKKDSIFLHDDILNECKDLVNAFKEVLPFYSDTSETRINSDEWDKIGQIIRKKDVKAQEIYDEASRWLKEVFSDYGCFTILGI